MILGDELYVKSVRSADDVDFVTAMGDGHPLCRLCSRRDLYGQFTHRNTGMVCCPMRSGPAQVRADNELDDLRYFVGGTLQAFQGHDWSEQFELYSLPEPPEPTLVKDAVGQIDELSRTFPTFVLPTPSYLFLGRFRLLWPNPSAAGCDHVPHSDVILSPTGETVSIGHVARKWRETVDAFGAHAVGQIVVAVGGLQGSRLIPSGGSTR